MSRKIIDLWKLDPNWKFAAEHGEASQTGKVNPQIQMNLKNNILMCPCCLKVIHKQPVSLCQNPKELHFLGYGFPLFYNMIKYCYISLLLLILSSSAISLYLSVIQTCEKDHTNSKYDYTYPCRGFFVKMSRAQPDPENMDIDRIMRSLAWIGQAILLLYFRTVQRKLDEYHHERNTRIKDYSIIFKNLPKVTHIQKTLKDFLKSLEIPLKVEQIFLIPKIDMVYELEDKKKEIIEKLKKVMGNKEPDLAEKAQLQAELELVNIQLVQTCKKIDDLYHHDNLYSEKAIVILETKQQKRAVLQRFPDVLLEEKQRYFAQMASQVTLNSAPEPRQIIWECINYPKYKRWLRVLLGWILSILFLGGATAAFYFLVVFRAQSHSLSMLIISLLLIQFFNKYIMKVFLHLFCDLEKPETSSEREFSYACKYAFGMFFTTAIISILVEAVIFGNVEFQYGVVEGETYMFFFNAFIVNLLWIVHPQYYIRKLQRWWKFGSKNITQKEANEVMEDYPYDMGKRYAEILQTMWFTFLYASLIPFGTFLTLIGLMIYYWVDKYNLLRRSKVQNIIESKLPLKAVKLMELTIFWKPLGEIIIDIRLRQTVFPQTPVMIGLSIIFLLIPWNWVLDKFFHENFNLSKQTYQQAKFHFIQTYQTVDPVQRMISLEKFIENQNRSRKELLEKDSSPTVPTYLEIRNYAVDQVLRNNDGSAKHMSPDEEPVEQLFSIRLEPSDKRIQESNEQNQQNQQNEV